MNKLKKRWWKSRTLWINTALAAGTVAEAHFGLLQAMLGPKAYLIGMALIAAVNCFLRTITTEALAIKKEAPKP